MAENQEFTPSQSNSESVLQKLSGDETALSLNDKGIISDSEYSEQRGKLFDRGKLQFWWRSVSRVANMIAAVLIPAAVTILVMGIAKGFVGGELLTLGVIAGTAAVALAVGIGTDYFENAVNQRQSFDREEFGYRRQGTAIARAINEEIVKNPQAATPISWQEKTARDGQPVSIHMG